MRYRKLQFLCLSLLLGILNACHPTPKFSTTDITGADYARDFSLIDHTGKPRSLADFKGKVVSLFFGYTSCSDVCPTTLLRMAEVMKMLGKDAKRTQVLFITLDPERDTPQLLAQYVPAFHPDFLGLYGNLATTQKTAKDFRIFYEKHPAKTEAEKNYTIDHSIGIYIFDPKGKLRLYATHDTTPAAIAKDVAQLLAAK